MTEIKKIDLHIHTTVSDGTDRPEEIIDRVREAGIDLFSVTDHDAMYSSEVVLQHLKAGDPRFIPGIEFSCRDELGKYHILGYAYDPHAETIRSIVETGHNTRVEKMGLRLDLIREKFGIVFSQEDRDLLFANHNPGKPHLANLLVRHGFAESISQAFRDYLDSLEVPAVYIRPEEAIRAVLQSGGIPVLAHPSYGSGDELIIGDEMEGRLRRLIGFGLAGVEAYYSGFTARLQNEMLRFAEKFGLYVTAGSDYHGSNKMIRLGHNHLEDAGEAPDGLHRFLEAVLPWD